VRTKSPNSAALQAITLLYHDVIRGDPNSSGFRGGGPARYKLSSDQFAQHLDALAAVRPEGPVRAADVSLAIGAIPSLLLTFDDGGSSAVIAAEMLDARGWHGHFLITVERIGTSGFVSAGDIRALRRHGHTIGSHSYSHPDPISRCSPDVLVDEWQRSIETLEDIVGEPVTVASVPGGSYSRDVARAAARSGVKTLFTSEPVTSGRWIEGCLVLGRFTLLSGTPARVAAALASKQTAPRFKQFVVWNARKLPKSVAGDRYLQLRRRVLNWRAQPEP
jgi:peptidoglycan/xylan/chitin deacetylase (PgdA/CDA1 family)